MRRLASLVVVALLTQGVYADEPVETTEARSLYSAGEVAFRTGRYETALTRFRDAYALSKRPQLLYNIALCEDRLGQVDQAISDYSSFLLEAQDEAARKDVFSRLRELRSRPRPPPVTAVVASPTPPPRRPVYKRAWFWGTLVGVAAGVGVGLGVGLGLGLRHDAFSTNLESRGPGAR